MSQMIVTKRDCPYFPCHPNADPDTVNCLFCYCPLYALGEDCGGTFRYTADGIKDCSDCLLPHKKEGFDHVIARLQTAHPGYEQKET